MSTTNVLDSVIHEPEQEAKASIIWLHGLGADGHDFVDVIPMLNLKDKPIRFVFPHAPQRPVTLNFGMVMRAWYDLESLSFDQTEDEGGIRQSAKLVERLIDEQVKQVGSDNVFIVGFSQGGAMALHVALRYPEKLAGCVCLSGYLPLRAHLSKEISDKNADIPVFLGHGVIDPTVPFVLGTETQSCLQAVGINPAFHQYPIGHQVSVDEMAHLGAWIAQKLNQ